MADLEDLEVDCYSLLLCVYILTTFLWSAKTFIKFLHLTIWWSTHNLAITGNLNNAYERAKRHSYKKRQLFIVRQKNAFITNEPIQSRAVTGYAWNPNYPWHFSIHPKCTMLFRIFGSQTRLVKSNISLASSTWGMIPCQHLLELAQGAFHGNQLQQFI